MKIILLFSLLIFYSDKSFCQTDSLAFNLSIHAKDLSEDMNRLTSKNDELMLLIYEFEDSMKILGSPLLQEMFVLDTGNTIKRIPQSKLPEGKCLLVLLEMDDDRTIEQVDPVIRIYHQELRILFYNKKNQLLEKYLGDNDLMGFAFINLSKEDHQLDIKGRLNLDSYLYHLQFSVIK